jgi:tetratricopeptide (TPR) repeat protein
MKHRDHINHAEFSPDGRRIATASGWALWMNGEARVWDAATGRPLSPPLQHGHNIEFATFSPDGQRLATVSCDGTARLWNGARGTPLTPIFQYSRDGDHWFNWPAFSRDGRRLFTASFDGTVRVWNVATGKPIRQILKRGAPVEAVWWSPDERRGVTYNSRPGWVELWDMATGKPIRQLIKPVSTNPRVTFSPDGRFVATAGDDNTVRVWLAATGEARTPPMKHGAYISSIAFSPDSRLLATACGDGTVRLWDTETGVAVTAPLKRRDVSQVAFSPDGHRLVAVCGGGIVQVWNMAADDQPALDAVRLAHLLSGHQIDDTAGFVPIAPEAARAAWAALRPKRPAEFTVASDQSLAWHLREAENLERSRQWPAAISYLTAVIAASPGPAGRAWAFLHARRAAAEGELGLWAEAASDGARAIALGVDDVRVWYRYALVQVRLGDSAGYRRTCATMLERFGGSPTAQEGIHVGMMCALAPNAVPDLTRPLEVAERLAANWVPYQEFRNNLGALLYRAGRFDDALRRLNEAAHQSYEYFDERAESGKAYNALFLAMCHDRLGHREEARRFLDRAVTWIDEATQRKPQIGEDTSIEAGAALPWWQRLELQILRAEAEGLIGSVRG